MLIKERGIIWIWLSAIVILIDQWTKWIASQQLELYAAQPVTGFLNWTLMHNRGIAFSLLADQPGWQRWVITCVASAVVVWLFVWLSKNKRKDTLINVSLALIIGGAIGNIIDRALLGYVIDFVEVYYKDYYWPAFNVADSAISMGAVLLIFDTIFSKNEDHTR